MTPEEVTESVKLFTEVKKEIDSGATFDLKSFSSGFGKGYGTYTPDMINNSMKSININPLTATVEKIEAALNDAKNNEGLLIAYGQDMYLKNMLYKRNFDYISDLPIWDLAIACPGITAETCKTPAFKKDSVIARDFLKKFDYRAQFSKAFFNMLNAETYYCVLRKDIIPEKYVLQDFPYEYAKLTGRSTWGLCYDIDMTYFTKPSIDIDLYPPWIKERFNELFTKNSQIKYMPSNPSTKRDGSFAMWVQTSFENDFWAFKFKNDIIANIPYFSPMLNELALIPVFRNLQVSQSMAAARKIIASQYPLLKEQRNANVSDMLAVKPETMGMFLGTIAKNLEDSFKLISLPSEEIQAFEFKNTDKDSYSDFIKITSSLMGGGNVLFNTVKNNVEETRLALNIDEVLATSIYSQFQDFLEYQINSLTKNFKFKFKFSGTNTYLNKKTKFENAFDSGSKGVVSINKLANSLDMNMFEFIDELEMTKGLGLVDKFMPMLNMYTETTDKNGRPQSAETELSESGAETRGSGANLTKGGSV